MQSSYLYLTAAWMVRCLSIALLVGAGPCCWKRSSWGRLVIKFPLWRWVSLPQSLFHCSKRLHLDTESRVENELI